MKRLSEEHKAKIKATCKAKAITGIFNTNLGKKMSEEQKLKLSIANKGKKKTEEAKRRMSEAQKGIKRNHHGKKHGFALNPKFGPDNKAWKGGVSKKNKGETKLIRDSAKYGEWRLMVFGRDNFTCQACGEKGVYLNAHHKLEFAKYPELRFDVSNGITLCKECHSKVHYKGLVLSGEVLNGIQ